MAVLVPAVVVIGALYLYGSRITTLEGTVKELKDEVHKHQGNTAIHIDPNRDKEIWANFQHENTRRFDRLEEKVDRIAIYLPAPSKPVA